MRVSIFVALLIMAAAAPKARAAEFPYEAYIATQSAEIVAGPGHRFYATDRLPRGTKVEIYREESSGWLAIRPPEGSFSWVPGEMVERLDDDHLGRVKEATGAWIGTSVEHVSEHQQQVTLKAGELVQIIGEKSIDSRSGGQRTWLKIAPPAGEYRWVYLRDVSRQKPEEPIAEVAIDERIEPEERAVAPAHFQTEHEQPSEPRRLPMAGSSIALRDIDERPLRIDRAIQPAQFRSTTSGGGDSRPVSPDGFVARKRRGDEPPQAVTAPSTSRPRLDPDARIATTAPSRLSPSPNPASATSGSGLSSDEISRQLDQIELDLSLMVAQDRSQWNLEGLRRRVQTLVDGGADPISRGRARLVLDKIKQFENAFDRDARTVSSTSRGTTGAPQTVSSSTPATGSLADPRYDAQGWLRPVISRKSDKPIAPFAVVDADGQPLCFISPAPGLNLHRYENKQVGLYGRRGYLEELKKPHLVAERVIELDGRLR
jgi:hypothetical protein